MRISHNRLGRGLSFRLRVSPLEDRTNPSGNVTALVFDGVLYVGGDDLANAFNVSGTGDGTATVAPADADTTINGQTGVLPFSGIRKGYHIVSGEGNDTIRVIGAGVRDTVNIYTAGGDDVVGIEGVNAGKGSIVDLGDGNNRAAVAGSTFGKLFSLRAGSGDDVLNASGNSFRQMALFNGGGGTNTSTLAGNSFTKGMVSLFTPVPASPARMDPSAPTDPTPPDTVAPSVVLSTSAPANTNRTPIAFTATFSEVVPQFSSTSILVTNGVVSNLSTADSRTFTFDITPVSDGPVSVSIPAGATSDAAGNSSTASNQIDLTFDTVAPTVTANSRTTNDATPTLTGTVSESTATVEVTVDGVTYNAVVSINTWTADVTANLTDGTRTVSVRASDAAGNATTATATLVIDSTAVGLSLSTTAASITNASTLPYTARFDRSVTDFAASDIAVTNGTLSNFVAVDGTTYTFDIAPTADGPVGVSVAAGAAQDATGGSSLAANSTVTRDTVSPTPAITTSESSTTLASPIPFTVTFPEAVTGFDASDITASNATVSNFVAASATTYTFDATPTADGSVVVSVLSGVATDLAGNASTTATASVNSLRTAEGTTSVVPDTTSFTPLGSDGLKIRDVRTGTGTAATAASTVTVFYTGWLASDGTSFDSARTTGSPAEFALSGLIAGFSQGTVGMQPGGIRQVFIPAALGYGSAGSPPAIPANADLVFEIKLLATT